MTFSFIPKLKAALKSVIDRTSATATVNSPEAAALMKATSLSTKLDRLDKLPADADRVRVVAEAAAVLGSSRPSNYEHSVSINETLAAALKEVTKQSGAAGASTASSPSEEFDNVVMEIVDTASIAPRNLDQAREALGAIRTFAQQLSVLKPGLAASAGSLVHSSDASAELAFLGEQFAAAGLIPPPRNSPGVTRDYLKRQIETKVQSGGFGATATATTSGVAVGAVTIRKSDIVVPPTDADYLAIYKKFQADPSASAKRQAFYAEHGGAIHRAIAAETSAAKSVATRTTLEARLKRS